MSMSWASRSSGFRIVIGFTSGGDYIRVVFEWADEEGEIAYPLTAYPLEE
jgi:hypothetical protein